MEERRGFERVAVEVVFMYELEDCPDVDEVTVHSMGTAVIRDISLSGARIRTLGQQLPEGCSLRASITSMTDGKSIEIVGRIVWSKEVDSETFDCGIQFLRGREEASELLRACVQAFGKSPG